MKFDVKVEAKISDDQKVIKAFSGALVELMFFMEGHAVRLAPVDTGRLRASIHTDKINDFHWILADGVDYGVYQEYGTINMEAQPFMRPSLNIGQQQAPIIVQKHLQKVI